MAGETIKITGLEECKAILSGLPAKLRYRALRNALAAGGRLVANEAKRRAPILKLTTYSGASAFKRGIRKPGTLRAAIRVRTSKIEKRRGNVGVFVNVKPASGSNAGANSPNDPFYWRFVNFGYNPPYKTDGSGKVGKRHRRRLNRLRQVKRKSGARFLEAGAAMLGKALEAFKAKLGPQLQRLNTSPKADLQ